MTKPAADMPQRRVSQSNRARILAMARLELGRNPDVTMEELARASGVVRRTLFGNFPGRAALLEALAEEASEALREALAERAKPEAPAERALAHFALSIWPVADRYRLLLALTRRDLGAERVAEILAPARAEATAILERGQRDGVFHTRLPPTVLGAGLEAMYIALLEQVNSGALEDDGARTAVAVLIAAGVPEKRGRVAVGDLAPAVTEKTGADG
ncbi:TetR family transcriptional regulator [Streptomyces sp. NPDC096040]|uniref:TetR/AcrR family transcriptional regulator n=1 Tax=Streptomyces sp. NPDC096040 TaxID=3155541 RepID=UPI003325E335